MFEGAEDFDGGVAAGLAHEQLAGDVAAAIGEAPDAGVADLAGERSHGAEDFAEGGAVVIGNPAAEGQELLLEHGFGVEEAENLLGGDVGGRVVGVDDDAGEFARSEGDDDSAAGLDAVAQRFGQTVGEGAVQRDGQAHVNVFKIDGHRVTFAPMSGVLKCEGAN